MGGRGMGGDRVSIYGSLDFGSLFTVAAAAVGVGSGDDRWGPRPIMYISDLLTINYVQQAAYHEANDDFARTTDRMI